jgi:hypothetical protein
MRSRHNDALCSPQYCAAIDMRAPFSVMQSMQLCDQCSRCDCAINAIDAIAGTALSDDTLGGSTAISWQPTSARANTRARTHARTHARTRTHTHAHCSRPAAAAASEGSHAASAGRRGRAAGAGNGSPPPPPMPFPPAAAAAAGHLSPARTAAAAAAASPSPGGASGGAGHVLEASDLTVLSLLSFAVCRTFCSLPIMSAARTSDALLADTYPAMCSPTPIVYLHFFFARCVRRHLSFICVFFPFALRLICAPVRCAGAQLLRTFASARLGRLRARARAQSLPRHRTC